jgi:hypothetical protein
MRNFKKVASDIIKMQYPDEFGLSNYFLEQVINEIVLQHAPKIKSYADAIFERGEKYLTDDHSLECHVIRNDKKMSVLDLYDESHYGPGMHRILVVDDKMRGDFHIRSIDVPANELYGPDFKIDCSFTSPGFVLTYHYMTDTMRSLLSYKPDPSGLENLRSIENMRDITMRTYDKVVYSANILLNILR